MESAEVDRPDEQEGSVNLMTILEGKDDLLETL
jgi:hypothetical protein